MITLGYLPYMEDPRGMYFVGNSVQAKADLNGDGKEELMRIDAFNFWGGNSAQNILIVENDQSDLLGCWHLGEYRSHINDLNSRSEVIYVDMTTHQTNDSMASPTKQVRAYPVSF